MDSRRIETLAWLGLATGAGCLMAGFLAAGIWPAVLLCLVLAALWVLARRSSRQAGLGLLFIAWAALAGAGFWLGLPGLANLLPLAGLLGILVAYDLESFARRLAAASLAPDRPGLERAHLARLGLVLGAGGSLAGAALFSRFQMSFGAAVLLSLVAILGLIFGLNRLRFLRETFPREESR